MIGSPQFDGAEPPLVARTFPTMGTVVSLTTPIGSSLADDAFAKVVGVFEAYDKQFSLYDPVAELARIAAGRLELRAASASLREVYALAIRWRNDTGGEFTPHRPDGVIDLAGVVKALAIRDAGQLLDNVGVAHWCLNAGGDVLCRGVASGFGDGVAPWIVGLVDPDDREALLTAVALPQSGAHRAVATSGSAERGEHIWSSGAAASGDAFVQVSVLAPDIVTADVLATAIVAGGSAMVERATAGWPVDVLVVRANGELMVTPGFRAAIAARLSA
jgi:thiamine biosynthesis lipoprotein